LRERKDELGSPVNADFLRRSLSKEEVDCQVWANESVSASYQWLHYHYLSNEML